MTRARWWMRPTRRLTGVASARPWRQAAVLGLFATMVGGCLGAPEIEDRWTRVDLLSSNLTPGQAIAPGSSQTITMSTTVTYRRILTGFVVADLRASTTPSGTVVLNADAPREPMALDIDQILANSVSMGRATRAVTGWDHLIQHLDFSFTGVGPASTDSTGAPVNLYLVCYMGDGVELERQGRPDTLIVTPWMSTAYSILPVGIELAVGGP